MHSRVFSIVLVCVLAACGNSVGDPPSGGDGDGGGGGGDGGGGGGGSITATQFLAELEKKFCDQAFMCKANFPADEGVTFEQVYGTSAMQCYADGEMYNMPAAVEAAITGGTITFNGADAATCINGITFPACATYWTDGPNMPAACDTALIGKVADGGACTIDYECMNLEAICDDTTKKCTVDTTMRTTRPMEIPLHMQAATRVL